MAALHPTRSSPRRGRTPRKQVEETVTSTTITETSSGDTSFRVTRSVTKKLIAEEKEALPTEMKPTPTKTAHGYEFGGPVGVFFMIISLPVTVMAFYLCCNGNGPCTFLQMPVYVPPLWRYVGGVFDIGHLIFDGWIIFQAVIYMLPIGKVNCVTYI